MDCSPLALLPETSTGKPERGEDVVKRDGRSFPKKSASDDYIWGACDWTVSEDAVLAAFYGRTIFAGGENPSLSSPITSACEIMPQLLSISKLAFVSPGGKPNA